MNDDLQKFTLAYVQAIFFTETGDLEQPESDVELDPEFELDIQAECRSFWRRFGCYVTSDICIKHCGSRNYAISAAGADFWFTRNGHGVGFWEPRRWPECYRKMLDAGAKSYGEVWTYESDDGLLAGG